MKRIIALFLIGALSMSGLVPSAAAGPCEDTDNDGECDNNDGDDDNDGIPDAEDHRPKDTSTTGSVRDNVLETFEDATP